MMKAMRRFKKGDLIFVSVIGILVIITLLWSHFTSAGQSGDDLTAVIVRDGETIEKIDLNKLQEPRYIKLDNDVTILAEHGSIKFLEADCPDKICIKAGTLTRPGDIAVCLPNNTIVTIEDD